MRWLLLLVLLVGCSAAETARPRQSTPVPQHPSHQETAPLDPTGFTGEFGAYVAQEANFYRPERMEDVRRLLPLCGPLQGATVADVGCGSGFYSFVFGRAVGPGGRVLAIDLNPKAVRYVWETAQRDGVLNVWPRQTLPDDPGLSPESVDLLFLSGMHHLNYGPRSDDPVGMLWQERRLFLSRLYDALRPGGRMVIVEGSQETNPDSALDEAQFVALVERAGFRFESSHPEFRRTDYTLVFRR